jgi:hypothetical protein
MVKELVGKGFTGDKGNASVDALTTVQRELWAELGLDGRPEPVGEQTPEQPTSAAVLLLSLGA